ncbi:MAG: thioredoxin, partial [Armatimonadota bacterium]
RSGNRVSEPQVSHGVAPVPAPEDADTESKGVENMSSAAAVSAATFDREVLQSKEPVLVDFWAPWCGPCKMMAPTLDQLAQDYAGKVKVVKLNTDENQEIAARYGIRGIPTLILFKGGEPIDRAVGVQPKNVLAAKLDQAMEH